MNVVPTVRLQSSRVSDELGKTLDSIVGEDIVLRPEAVTNLDPSRELQTLGIIGLTHSLRPPYALPYKCTWYQGRYYCRFYRRAAWYLVWDQAEASPEMRDLVAEGPSTSREDVKEFARANGVHEKFGCWRPGHVLTEEEKREAAASGFFDRK
jgi:hypothetical protein